MSEIYEYLPDGCTRVLWIHDGPGSYHTFIVSLHTLQLKDICVHDATQRSIHARTSLGLGDYDALSYTWGSPFSTAKLKAMYTRDHDVAILVKNDSSCSYSTVNIGKNLFEALCQLWQLGRRRYLWIDALCINQSDQTEKAKQVLLMGTIFSAAKTVVAWTGIDDPDLPVFSDLVRVVEEAWNLVSTVDSRDLTIQYNEDGVALRIIDMASSFAISAESMRSVVRFFARRRYFARAWITQEISLNTFSSFLLGAHLFPLGRLLGLSILFGQNESVLRRFQQREPCQETSGTVTELFHLISLNRRRYSWHRVGSTEADEIKCHLKDYHGYYDAKSEWLGLLEHHVMLYARHCTDPRDAIYSIIGFVSALRPLGAIPFDVDYGCSIEQVYTDVTSLILQHLPHYSILSAVCQRDPEADYTERLPSWVPDYKNFRRVHHPIRAFVGNVSAIGKHWLKGSREPAILAEQRAGIDGNVFKPIIIDRMLIIYGRLCGTVHDSVRPGVDCLLNRDKEDDLQAWLDVVLPAIQLAVKYDQNMCTSIWKLLISASPLLGYSYDEHFLQRVRACLIWTLLEVSTIVDGSRRFGIECTLEATLASAIHLFTQSLGQPWCPEKVSLDTIERCGHPQDISETDLFLVKEHKSDLPSVILQESSTLFLTNSHLVGKTNNLVQQSDQLWLICNARVPFVLRPNADGSYHLLGEALVDGAMQGELIHNGTAGPIQQIHLK